MKSKEVDKSERFRYVFTCIFEFNDHHSLYSSLSLKANGADFKVKLAVTFNITVKTDFKVKLAVTFYITVKTSGNYVHEDKGG